MKHEHLLIAFAQSGRSCWLSLTPCEADFANLEQEQLMRVLIDRRGRPALTQASAMRMDRLLSAWQQSTSHRRARIEVVLGTGGVTITNARA